MAASPDGLVGEDGMVEVKCPYSTRNIRPNEAKLDYLDQRGDLKKVHNYYFQVQGCLEITNRKLECDFVVFTFQGIKTQRSYRDTNVFQKLLPCLQNFYYFYQLPKIIFPSLQFSNIKERIWNILKPIHILSNGLVDDIYYYKNFTDGKGYTVATFRNRNCYIKEILTDDYHSLTDKGWLANTGMDILLNIINKNEAFQIISSGYSSHLFSTEQNMSDIFVKDVVFTKGSLAFPILVNNNHWCLALVNIEKKIFRFMDPYGTNESKTKRYLELFLKYLKSYNKHLSFIFEEFSIREMP